MRIEGVEGEFYKCLLVRDFEVRSIRVINKMFRVGVCRKVS